VGRPTEQVPAPGTVWVDAAMLSSLNAKLGDTLKLGDKAFTITQLIAAEPDRGALPELRSARDAALSDLAATALVQNGSRVIYRLLLSAPPARAADCAISSLAGKPDQGAIHQGRAHRIAGIGQPADAVHLDRADRFLSLVGLLSAMLAAVAVAMAARRFMLRHLDACAMLRCLGLTQNQVTAMYDRIPAGRPGRQRGGRAGGLRRPPGAAGVLGKLVPSDLPPVSLLPALQGVATGMLLLLGFALPPILQLRNVPHNRVIRREQEPPQALALATYGLGIAAFVVLLLWQAGDVKLALLTAAGFLGASPCSRWWAGWASAR
jgi:putative ABC transport system permease protein